MSNEPSIEEILADLDALKPEDFNPNNQQANGMEKLWILTDQLSKVGEPEKVEIKQSRPTRLRPVFYLFAVLMLLTATAAASTRPLTIT